VALQVIDGSTGAAIHQYEVAQQSAEEVPGDQVAQGQMIARARTQAARLQMDSICAIGRFVGLSVERGTKGGGDREESKVSEIDDSAAVGVEAAPEATGASARAVVAERVKAMGAIKMFRVMSKAAARMIASNATLASKASLEVLWRTLETAGEGGVETLKLDRGSMLALQSLARSNTQNDPQIGRLCGLLLDKLGEIFSEQSGSGFIAKIMAALEAAEEARGCGRFRDQDDDDAGAWGATYYSSPESDEASWEAPAVLTELLDKLWEMHKVTRVLDDEAVTECPDEGIAGLLAIAEERADDVGAVEMAISALARLCAKIDNVDALHRIDGIPRVITIAKQYSTSERVSEAIAELILPLSFEAEHTREAASAGATECLLAIVK